MPVKRNTSELVLSAAGGVSVVGLASYGFCLVPPGYTGAAVAKGASPQRSADYFFRTYKALNQAPDCGRAEPSRVSLWPPNHNFVSIDVLGVTDPDDDTATLTIDSIYQDEPADAPGSGNTAPDGRVIDGDTVEVRAERDETGDGRVYHMGFTDDDGQGGTCAGKVLVGVPLSKKGTAAVRGRPLYDSTAE